MVEAMTRVCFVCLGNICRSPTALAVTRYEAAKRGLLGRIELDSAGTGAYHVGNGPDERSIAAAKRRGIELSGKARQFTTADFARFDYVLAMDTENLLNLRKLAPKNYQGVLALFRSFDPTSEPNASVPDPYFGGEAGFDEVIDQCERAARGLLSTIVGDLG
jgi:protein-tyrosine phosphatase